MKEKENCNTWHGRRILFFLGIKKNRAACGDLEGIIQPVLRCSLMKVLQVSFSVGLSGYTLAILGMNISLRSMVWSNG